MKQPLPGERKGLRGSPSASGGSEDAVGAGLGHDLDLGGFALQIAVFGLAPAAPGPADGAEAVGEVVGGLKGEVAVRRHISIVSAPIVKDKAKLLQSS